MSTRVIINVLETGGGGDPPDQDPAGAGLYLPTAYEATPFFAVFEFLIEETIIDPVTNEEIINVYPATKVTTNFNFSQYSITYTQINANTSRIDGPVLNAFPDQFYQFVLPDLSTPILPFDTEEDFLSLIRYKKPSANQILLEYTFEVNDTFNVSVFQWIIWLFVTAVNNIDALVARGLK
jgi:hypothetical protein